MSVTDFINPDDTARFYDIQEKREEAKQGAKNIMDSVKSF